ncbi:antibiotic biosynthesis monooxygenase family protein [Geminocystis sp. NIES-3709]|uniref:antibiotic biosynthesis monooxygenase family protein n=1 Tax=Geminocystis sp. NIES-3709 TaxID=1617448 RepID=UPI00082456D0|nr:antibiotic biosynthesis monooxygenase family protein [Geminocystis sp. NIES-3709]
MAITRIFRVQIHTQFRIEFEDKFSDLSLRTVEEASGFISASIHKPTKWSPNEYMMISYWKNEAALIAFAGEKWNVSVIPYGMEKFVKKCSVYHYESWD